MLHLHLKQFGSTCAVLLFACIGLALCVYWLFSSFKNQYINNYKKIDFNKIDKYKQQCYAYASKIKPQLDNIYFRSLNFSLGGGGGVVKISVKK